MGRFRFVSAKQGSPDVTAVNGPMGHEDSFLVAKKKTKKKTNWRCWCPFLWILMYLDIMPGRRAPIEPPGPGWGQHVAGQRGWGSSCRPSSELPAAPGCQPQSLTCNDHFLRPLFFTPLPRPTPSAPVKSSFPRHTCTFLKALPSFLRLALLWWTWQFWGTGVGYFVAVPLWESVWCYFHAEFSDEFWRPRLPEVKCLSHHILTRRGTCLQHDLSLQRLTLICLVFPLCSAPWKAALCRSHLRSEGLFPQRVVSGKAWQGSQGGAPTRVTHGVLRSQGVDQARVSATLCHRLGPACDRPGLSTDVALIQNVAAGTVGQSPPCSQRASGHLLTDARATGSSHV